MISLTTLTLQVNTRTWVREPSPSGPKLAVLIMQHLLAHLAGVGEAWTILCCGLSFHQWDLKVMCKHMIEMANLCLQLLLVYGDAVSLFTPWHVSWSCYLSGFDGKLMHTKTIQHVLLPSFCNNALEQAQLMCGWSEQMHRYYPAVAWIYWCIPWIHHMGNAFTMQLWRIL